MIVSCNIWLILSVQAYGVYHIGQLSLDLVVTICITATSWPSSIANLFGGVFLDYVARVAIVGRVQPIIDRVRGSTPASIDFDKLLADIVKAQHLNSAVCAKMEQPIVLQIVANTAAGFACTLIGLGPHPRDPGHWWRQYHLSDGVLFFGATWFLSTFLILWQTSKVTSVCDTLGDAINELIEAQEPGAATVCMPTTDQQRNIEHLCSYVRGLNRGRGMGFVMFRKRISHSFTIALAMKVISVMTISFPVILSLTRIEEGEDEILNNTEVCAGL